MFPPSRSDPLNQTLSGVPSVRPGGNLLTLLLAHQRRYWQAGQRPLAERYGEQLPELRDNDELFLDLIWSEFLLREELGEAPSLAEYQQRFPHFATALACQFDLHRALAASLPLLANTPASASPPTRVAAADALLAPTCVPAAGPDGQDRVGQEGVHVPGYEILKELGRGGMGIVYQARHLRLNRVVALKMILAGATAGQDDLVRFLTEAEAVATLQHPHIVQLYEFGQHRGLPYFTLEFVAGGNLAARLQGKPLPSREAARLVEQLARGMHCAHAWGIVHRDLKPHNVLLTEDGSPKITDFGLAKRVAVGSGLTLSGVVMGTPSYMAPEQARGSSKQVGPAADVYALGAILYECLTGRPPFLGQTPVETLMKVLHEEPVAVRTRQPGVSRDLETICQRCLHKDPQRRYASALELAEDLRRFQAGEPILAKAVGLVERLLKWARRQPAAATLLLLGVLLLPILLAAGFFYRQQLREARSAARATSLVRALDTAETSAVPRLLGELAEYQHWAEPRLRELLETAPAGSRTQLHARLALLPRDLGQAEPLVDALPQAEPEELLVVRDALRGHADKVSRLWPVLLEDKEGSRRLRAACALAAFAPDDPRWKQAAPAVVSRLLAENQLLVGRWAAALRPVRGVLAPDLAAASRDARRPEAQRQLATSLAADFAADRADLLAELLLDADAQQFLTLFPLLQRRREEALPRLRAALGPNPKDAATDVLASRRVNAAVALLRLQEPEPAWRLLRHGPDPTARSFLVQRLALLQADAGTLAAHLGSESDPSVQRALILSLGDFNETQLPSSVREPLTRTLLYRYRTDPDPGIHSAIDWLLGRDKEGDQPRPLNWGQAEQLRQIDDNLRGQPPLPVPGPRGWFVTSAGQTMALFRGPVVFDVGSPPSEPYRADDETLHRRRISRHFALATKTVTVRQFEEFLKAHPEIRHTYREKYSPDREGPMVAVTWFEAAQYCRWLSEQDRAISADQYCYPSVADIEKSKDGITPLRLPNKYLSRKGYRLPTEAEWEYACRAEASTSRYYGNTSALLDRYAWHLQNSGDHAWPVGQKRPNDFGMFDMHGNAWQWCQGPFFFYPTESPAEPVEDQEILSDSKELSSGVVRGGSFGPHPAAVRCAYRVLVRPTFRLYSVGFRVARTCD
jgi:formylglycine-generating enzyme required for sulfatase activity